MYHFSTKTAQGHSTWAFPGPPVQAGPSTIQQYQYGFACAAPKIRSHLVRGGRPRLPRQHERAGARGRTPATK